MLTFNKTIGVFTFNLPPGVSCPGASDWCRDQCYAKRGNFQFPSVKQAQALAFERTKTHSFVPDMSAEIQGKVARVRIHSSGDFYSLDYLRAWCTIAASCPRTKFFAYTRTWRLGPTWIQALQAAPKNLRILASADPTTGNPRDSGWQGGVSWIESMPGACKPNCPKQQGKANCSTCNRCMSGRDVCFLKH